MHYLSSGLIPGGINFDYFIYLATNFQGFTVVGFIDFQPLVLRQI